MFQRINSRRNSVEYSRIASLQTCAEFYRSAILTTKAATMLSSHTNIIIIRYCYDRIMYNHKTKVCQLHKFGCYVLVLVRYDYITVSEYVDLVL